MSRKVAKSREEFLEHGRLVCFVEAKHQINRWLLSGERTADNRRGR
jgi:hypothetical protein